MVHKNMVFGASQNCTIAEFGTGDIIVSSGTTTDNKKTALTLRNSTPMEIATPHPELYGVSSDEKECDFVMLFSDPKSIDVLIEALQKSKENLIDIQSKTV